MSENNPQAIELAESTAGYAGRLYNQLEKVVDDLRADRIKDGLTSLSQVTEGLEWMLDAVTALKQQGGIFADFDTAEMSSHISELIESVENSDYVLLADLVEYEIMPVVDDWGQKLDKITGKD